MRWTDGPLVGFDTETTGVDVAHDRIVTAALVVRHGLQGLPQERTWIIDPGVEIPEAASAIHGVTTEHARRLGRPPAEALEEIAAALAAAIADGAAVVAFNASYDLTILEHELVRHHLPTLHERLGRRPDAVLDPLVLDRALDRFRPGKRKLVDLAALYGVSTGELHAADVDVTATLDVLRALVGRFPELAEVPLPQMHARQIRAHRGWALGFNRWLREQGFDHPGAETTWPYHDPFAPPSEEIEAIVAAAREAALARSIGLTAPAPRRAEPPMQEPRAS
ncbi:exonuclease domain-containing protein [Beutenbergia cavernae]